MRRSIITSFVIVFATLFGSMLALEHTAFGDDIQKYLQRLEEISENGEAAKPEEMTLQQGADLIKEREKKLEQMNKSFDKRRQAMLQELKKDKEGDSSIGNDSDVNKLVFTDKDLDLTGNIVGELLKLFLESSPSAAAALAAGVATFLYPSPTEDKPIDFLHKTIEYDKDGKRITTYHTSPPKIEYDKDGKGHVTYGPVRAIDTFRSKKTETTQKKPALENNKIGDETHANNYNDKNIAIKKENSAEIKQNIDNGLPQKNEPSKKGYANNYGNKRKEVTESKDSVLVKKAERVKKLKKEKFVKDDTITDKELDKLALKEGVKEIQEMETDDKGTKSIMETHGSAVLSDKDKKQIEDFFRNYEWMKDYEKENSKTIAENEANRIIKEHGGNLTNDQERYILENEYRKRDVEHDYGWTRNYERENGKSIAKNEANRIIKKYGGNPANDQKRYILENEYRKRDVEYNYEWVKDYEKENGKTIAENEANRMIKEYGGNLTGVQERYIFENEYRKRDVEYDYEWTKEYEKENTASFAESEAERIIEEHGGNLTDKQMRQIAENEAWKWDVEFDVEKWEAEEEQRSIMGHNTQTAEMDIYPERINDMYEERGEHDGAGMDEYVKQMGVEQSNYGSSGMDEYTKNINDSYDDEGNNDDIAKYSDYTGSEFDNSNTSGSSMDEIGGTHKRALFASSMQDVGSAHKRDVEIADEARAETIRIAEEERVEAERQRKAEEARKIAEAEWQREAEEAMRIAEEERLEAEEREAYIAASSRSSSRKSNSTSGWDLFIGALSLGADIAGNRNADRSARRERERRQEEEAARRQAEYQAEYQARQTAARNEAVARKKAEQDRMREKYAEKARQRQAEEAQWEADRVAEKKENERWRKEQERLRAQEREDARVARAIKRKIKELQDRRRKEIEAARRMAIANRQRPNSISPGNYYYNPPAQGGTWGSDWGGGTGSGIEADPLPSHDYEYNEYSESDAKYWRDHPDEAAKRRESDLNSGSYGGYGSGAAQ